MSKNILITGGAGFIGSHLVDTLVEKDYEIIVYDNLEERVFGKIDSAPNYLNNNIKFIRGNVLDYDSFYSAIKEVEVVIHLAAAVGVGQSMYQISNYINNNTMGTANLLDILVNKEHNVEKLIVASSMSIYGEGKYECDSCGVKYPQFRKDDNLKKGKWEHYCTDCNKELKPIPTDEEKPLDSTSIYAMSKKHQEKMSLLIGKTYGINTTALRFFNVYGSRQALSNPYTGVCAIFSSNLLNGNSPMIFEDGLQTRDFISVKDICNSIILSMKMKSAEGEVFNVGTGIATTIKNLAELLCEKINPNISPKILHTYRPGDIRHCIADISKIRSKLEFRPEVSLNNGIEQLIQWVKLQRGKVTDKSREALEELKTKGLL